MNRDSYITFPHPTAFSGISLLKASYPPISQRTIDSFLETVDSYTRQREAKKPHYNPYYVRTPRNLLQLDLLDKQALATANAGIRYWLVCIDTFTRKVWVRPLRRKTTEFVTNAFRSILREIDHANVPVKRVLSDRGTEFVSAMFRRLLEESGIEQDHPTEHAHHVERVQRTLQSLIGKYCTQFETMSYSGIMQLAVKSYNNRRHRMIGMSPNKAEQVENQDKVRVALEKYWQKFEWRGRKGKKVRKKKPKPKFKVGDLVRARIKRRAFQNRSFLPTFSTEIYRVRSVEDHLPSPMYTIESLLDVPRREKFYQSQLQRVNLATFKIAKKYPRTRRINPDSGQEEMLVSWQGLPRTYDSFIPVIDIGLPRH